ncbi:ankyrin repeat domain-containing protein [Lysobacter sp. CFH 32150]|uniref:ankyrin repeat domain-containing protein n=1 Tax=Lysobacter sp. CFH 32150 TaxID=2927128 RepID=UPI001FA7ECF8|nr:ankyrin repeat domain-containing protein [Lysobacter sp. CFH 32150]MCI4568105.1 ankyrin repeat domain-containing protein [Lysobacter sp. CFH 32150]
MLLIKRGLPKFAIAAAVGVVLAALGGFGGVIAALAGTLAQPAFALAWSWRRGTRAAGDWRRDALALATLWGAGLAVVAVGVAWPLATLRESGSLGAAIGLSLVAGLLLLGLWRTWPLWHGLERDGGPWRTHVRSLGEVEVGVWRGLGVAALVAAVLTLVLLPAWPDLLIPTAQWLLAGALALLSPLAHWLLQRTPAATPLPQVELPFDDEDEAFDEHGLDATTPTTAVELNIALYAAARSGRVDRALALLEAGADAHALPPHEDRDQRTLPMLAAVLPDLRLLRGLIGHGADLNAAHAGMAPLLAATRDSWHGRPEAVMTLLANGADPRVADADGNTPLHHAARSSDPGVAALLRDAAAELDARNHDGVTPLGIACASGNWRLARFLLERGAKTEPANATPALLAAAAPEEDDAAGVALLLKHKAKVDARDRHGRSALHEAARAGHAEIVATLLAANADVQARDDRGRTPWLDAARGGHLAVIERLLPLRPELHTDDHEGRDALQLASAGDPPNLPLVQRLLELGLDPNRRGNDGKRAVDLAAESGRWSVVAALDPDYPLPATVTDAGPAAPPPDRAPATLLREGLLAGRYADLDALVQLLAPRELGALLLDTDIAAQPARIDWLLAHGADPEVRIDGGDNAMFAAISQGPAALPTLQTLLHRGVAPAGSGGVARFLSACVVTDHAGRGLEACALDLLERGADPFAPSLAGDPPLALAVRLGWSRLLERLVAHGVDLDARDSHGMTALHLAAALGREASLKALIAHGANPEMRAADGQTPLGVALSAGRRDLADWLDWRGWPLPKRALQASDLPAAAIVGEVDAVRRLLDLGLPVDALDTQGCTALLRAAGGGHRAVVDLLLARGADPKIAARSGATPLSAAVSMRQGEIVERLLDAGAPLEQRLPGEVTVLMLAAALGLPDLVARLLTAGADVHAGDAQGLAPLHCAALFGFTARERPRLVALLDTLVLAGAEPDQAAAGGVTPLLLLLGARAEPGTACDEEVVLAGLDRLLDEDVALDAKDPRGFGPLHLAALHGLLKVVQRLLRAGADPDLRDTLNRSAKEIAVMRGFVDVAAEFVPATPGGVSMARFLREPR